MTEVPSRGLLPQLTDVLYALTDSHRLLLFKLRSVHLEHEAVPPWADEHETPHAEFLDVVDRRPSAVVEPLTVTASLAHEAVHLPQFEEADLVRADRPMHVDTVAAATQPADEEVHLGEIESMHRPTPTRLDFPHTQGTEPLDSESSNRNYNYFDELDARLAHLGNDDPDQVKPQPSGLLSSHEHS